MVLSVSAMKLLLLLFLLLWESEATPHVNCKDENDIDVDWYILYKAPESQQYMYISSNGIVKTNKNIGASDSVLANTLSPMFDKTPPSTFGFLSYSDQPPQRTIYDTSDFSSFLFDLAALGLATVGVGDAVPYGHSKGVVLGDSAANKALWLTHSTPRFPNSRDRNSFWPNTGNAKGQTFMCVTFTYGDLQDIGRHLKHIHAKTFDSIIPPNFPQEIKDAANKISDVPQGQPAVIDLKAGNKAFKAVAKVTGANAAGGDLYVQLSKIFNSPMDVQSWGCQTGKDQSYCPTNQHHVMSVIEVQTALGDWSWTVDHSKWAVTSNQNIQWTCIADVNRAKTQYERPGGALCIQDQTVSDLFRAFVKNRLLCGVSPYDCKTLDLSHYTSMLLGYYSAIKSAVVSHF